jgi:hypothetical protein
MNYQHIHENNTSCIYPNKVRELFLKLLCIMKNGKTLLKHLRENLEQQP